MGESDEELNILCQLCKHCLVLSEADQLMCNVSCSRSSILYLRLLKKQLTWSQSMELSSLTQTPVSFLNLLGEQTSPP